MFKRKKSIDIIIDLIMRIFRVSLDSKVYQNSYGHPYRIHSVGYQVWLGKILLANYYALVDNKNTVCLIKWEGILKKHYIEKAQDRMLDYCEEKNPPERERKWFYWNERDTAINIYKKGVMHHE